MAEYEAMDPGVKNFELVSISFDPDHDSPGVLKEYAQVRGLDLSNWSFLTGPDAAVRQLLAQLGVIREFEGATIKHTLATVLKAPDLRERLSVEAVEPMVMTPEQFGAFVRADIARWTQLARARDIHLDS